MSGFTIPIPIPVSVSAILESVPTPIPICDIADMTIRKKDHYYAFATAEEPLGPYLEVTEHTKHFLHMPMFVLCWCYACIITHYDRYDGLFLRNTGKTLIYCVRS